jgi:hypothetical protein
MRITRTYSALALSLLLGACAPNTEVVNSWKEPSMQPQKFKKVLAVFISKDVGTRRAAEDELAKKLGNGIAAYTVIPDEALRDQERAKALVVAQDFDGAVVMRPVAVDQETTYVPGSSYVVPSAYGSMWGYWGTGWGYAYSPGYVQQDQVVSVESNVYSLTQNKLVWASRTKTYNPDSVRKLVNDIVDATVNQMKKEKVFASSTQDASVDLAVARAAVRLAGTPGL